MYNLDDNKLDQLSKAAADHYQAPGTPDWDRLSKTLDVELPVKKEKKRRGLFFLLLLAGLMVGGTLLWNHYSEYNSGRGISAVPRSNQTGNAPAKAAPASNMPANRQPAGTDLKSPAPGLSSAKERQTAPLTNEEEKTFLPPEKKKLKPLTHLSLTDKGGQKPGLSVATARTPNILSGSATAKIHKEKNSTLVSGNGPGISTGSIPAANHRKKSATNNNTNTSITGLEPSGQRKYRAPKIKAVAGKDRLASHPSPAKPANNDNQEDSPAGGEAKTEGKSKDQNDIQSAPVTPLTGKTLNNLSPVAAIDSQSAKQKEIPPTAGTTKTAAGKEKSRARAISVGLYAGGDYSTVGFSYMDKTGFNAGLIAGYYFSNRWSVNTGIGYTKKNYKLQGSDYHSPSGANTMGLQTVDGYCHMWEWPLLATYHFPSHTASNLFVRGGVSSYFMKREFYNFNYKMAGVWSTYSKTLDTPYDHWFSVLDLSAGVEKKAGPHFSWMLEPYVRLPLQGLGYGSIKLTSFGLNLTLQYQQKLKNKLSLK